ncbi:MAG TPA: rhodanese-like domain-containing protein [Pseudolabrys sp.]|jgi:rhodanese-related sulfurtransferase|nr:rhodanese-like domain-containing protein [Pseudolabrys sp.]
MIRNIACALGAAFMLAVAGPAKTDSLHILDATLVETTSPAPDISTRTMRRIVADGSAIVLDSRPRAEFDAGHIPGARVTEGSGKQRLAAIEHLLNGNKNAPLVLYCNGPYCQASRRLAGELVHSGFSNVKRYQLGIPVWRALGGPTVIELAGIKRIFSADRTAVFIDARPPAEFARGSLRNARSLPVDDLASGKLKKLPLPLDDFNRRVVLFGRDGTQARKLADLLSKRPWHNVAYYPGTFESLAAALGKK